MVARIAVLGLIFAVGVFGYGANYTEGGADWTSTCAVGTSQSPIHVELPVSKHDHVGDLTLNYAAVNSTDYTGGFMGNSYYVLGLNGSITGKSPSGEHEVSYDAKQLHFHSPSEHKVEGEFFDLELVIIHKEQAASNVTQPIGAIVVFFREGRSNLFLQQVIENHSTLDLNDLFESTKLGDFYSYEGSLTSPPCSENVAYYLAAEVQEASAGQLEFFKRHWEMDASFAGGHGNNRALQQVNNRTVYHWGHNIASLLVLSAFVFLG